MSFIFILDKRFIMRYNSQVAKFVLQKEKNMTDQIFIAIFVLVSAFSAGKFVETHSSFWLSVSVAWGLWVICNSILITGKNIIKEIKEK